MGAILNYFPDRTAKKRTNGLTIISDQGLTHEKLQEIVSRFSDNIDYIKLHSSQILDKDIKSKIEIIVKAGIHPFFSGNLFELFYVRRQFDQFLETIKELGLKHIEISDSIIEIPFVEKLNLISTLAKEFTVFSGIGYKHRYVVLTIDDWKKQIMNDINAGAWKVIIEGGVDGNSGIYEKNNEPKQGLILSLLSLDTNQIIWEANYTEQQAWFVNKLGANVNLSNINPSDILKLESLRLGLHSYTFFKYLPESTQIEFEKQISPLANIDFQI